MVVAVLGKGNFTWCAFLEIWENHKLHYEFQQ